MLQKMKLRSVVEQVLHVPGNYRGGILEMAIVFDCNIEKQTAIKISKEMVAALKQQSEVFRNVRLNTIQWRSASEMIKEITPMAYLQTGTYFDGYEQIREEKALEVLTEQLKKFYARSKLIIVLTDGKIMVREQGKLEKSLKPFLVKKLIYIKINKEKDEIQIERWWKNDKIKK